MKKKTTMILILVLSMEAFSQNTKILWSTLDAGAGTPASGNTVLRSAIGEAFVGNLVGPNIRLGSGFLVDTSLQRLLLPVEEKSILPLVRTYSLSQNYPNPFNPTTNIQYSLPSTQRVTLKIYDVLGREVTTLVDETKTTGAYRVTWDARGEASGMYVYRLVAGTYVETKKLLVLK